MSLKTELKMLVLHEEGVKADDMLESAKLRQAAHDGGKQVLRAAAKNLASLAALVDKDLEADKVPFEDPAKAAAYAKLMLDRASHVLLGAAQHQENLQLSVGGEITAYQGLVTHLKKELLSEQAKLEAQQTATPEDSRPLGAHPALSIAAQRRAEDASPLPEVTTDGTVVAKTADGTAKNGKRGGKKKTTS
jgi:hypothetical protein